MRNVAQDGFDNRKPSEFSTNSNPYPASHDSSVTHLLGVTAVQRVEWNMFGDGSVFVLRPLSLYGYGVHDWIRAYAQLRADGSGTRSIGEAQVRFKK